MLEPRSVRRLLSHSLVYGVGDLLTKMARYMLVPIYIAVMTPADIGQLAVLQAVTMIAWAINCLGFGALVRRYYWPTDQNDVSQDQIDQRNAWVGGLWWTRLVVAAIPTLLLVMLAWSFSQQLFPLVPVNLVVIACITGYLRASTDIVESWFMIREEPLRFRMLTFSQFVMTTTIILIAVLGMSLGIAGVVFGELLAAATWTIVTGWIVTRTHWPSIRQIRWSELFHYAWPIIPHAVFMWLLASGDRLILQHYVTSADIGVYEVAYVFGSVLMVIAQGLRAAWLPDYFRTAMHPDGMARYAHLTNLYLLAIFSGAAGIVLFCPELIFLVGGRAYAASVPLCRIVVIGITWFACFIAFNQPLLLKGRTQPLAALSGLGVLLNVGLNLALIPRFAATGSAIATVGAYSIMAVGSLLYSKFRLGVVWPLRSMVFGFLMLVILVIVSPHLGTATVGAILLKTLVLFALIVTIGQSTTGFGFLVDKRLLRN